MNLRSSLESSGRHAPAKTAHAAPEQPLCTNLIELNRLASLGSLSAGIAHEIKNSLVAAKTFLDLLLEKHQDDDLASTVRREISRIDSMLGQILSFSNPRPKPLQPLHIHQVLQHSLRLIQPRLTSKSIVLKQNLQANPDVIKGDEGQLQQVFLNLLLNAIDAIGSEGTISIHTEIASRPNRRLHKHDPGPQLRLTFSDTGVGIPLKDHARLFQPFFTTKPGGTGLGLSITSQIIKHHGGSIRVTSEPHKGSTFSILLPSTSGL